MSELLFEVPATKPIRKPYDNGQVYKCKRCKGSVSDKDGAYCHRFDLCIEFENGAALLAKNGMALKCDGETWTY